MTEDKRPIPSTADFWRSLDHNTLPDPHPLGVVLIGRVKMKKENSRIFVNDIVVEDVTIYLRGSGHLNDDLDEDKVEQ